MNIKAIAYKADVRDFEEAQRVASQVEDTFGKIDILINNAGITHDKLLMTMTHDEWRKVVDTNLDGVFNYTKSVIVKILKQKSGSIINFFESLAVSGQ